MVASRRLGGMLKNRVETSLNCNCQTSNEDTPQLAAVGFFISVIIFDFVYVSYKNEYVLEIGNCKIRALRKNGKVIVENPISDVYSVRTVISGRDGRKAYIRIAIRNKWRPITKGMSMFGKGLLDADFLKQIEQDIMEEKEKCQEKRD